jgi:hypothetical protein
VRASVPVIVSTPASKPANRVADVVVLDRYFFRGTKCKSVEKDHGDHGEFWSVQSVVEIRPFNTSHLYAFLRPVSSSRFQTSEFEAVLRIDVWMDGWMDELERVSRPSLRVSCGPIPRSMHSRKVGERLSDTIPLDKSEASQQAKLSFRSEQMSLL